MSAGELYRTISDDEYRGERFYEATFWFYKLWIPTTPYVYKGCFRAGDRLLLERIGTFLYAVRGIRTNELWHSPIASYSGCIEYQIGREFIAGMQLRPEGDT